MISKLRPETWQYLWLRPMHMSTSVSYFTYLRHAIKIAAECGARVSIRYITIATASVAAERVGGAVL